MNASRQEYSLLLVMTWVHLYVHFGCALVTGEHGRVSIVLFIAASATLDIRAERHASAVEVFTLITSLAVKLISNQVFHIYIVLFNIVSDGDDVARSLAHCIAKLLAFIYILQMIRVKFTRYLIKVIFEIRQRVRLEVGKECDVVLVVKLIAERKSVQRDHLRRLVIVLVAWNVVLVEFVVRRTLSDSGTQLVFVVANVFAGASPLIRAVLTVAFNRINEWFHAYLIARLVLLQVHDVEFVLATFGNIPHREEVPLTVRGRIEVKVDVAIVFEFMQLLHLVQITRFETRVEENGRFFDVLRREYDGVLGEVVGLP